MSHSERNACSLRDESASSRNRFRVDQIWAHSLTRNSKKFDMQTIVRICDVVKQFFNQIRVLRMQIDIKLKWKTYVKNIQKKNDHSIADVVAFHRLHLRDVFCQNTIDLQDDNQICCYLRIDHLTCVAWSLKYRRRYDDEVFQNATTMFENDQ